MSTSELHGMHHLFNLLPARVPYLLAPSVPSIESGLRSQSISCSLHLWCHCRGIGVSPFLVLSIVISRAMCRKNLWFLCMAVLALALYPDLSNVFSYSCINTCHISAANCSTSNNLWRGMENLDWWLTLSLSRTTCKDNLPFIHTSHYNQWI